MNTFLLRGWLRHGIAVVLLCAIAFVHTGCAAIFSGQSQTVTIRTVPEGRTVYYQGMAVNDGDVLTVRKRFKAPEVNIGDSNRPQFVELDYGPDLWLIGDCALLIFFLIPGLVALGVDFGTGAWRDLDDHQVLYVGAAD